MNVWKRLKQYDLLAVVFITGAAVLIVEVTAVRILSIYFGNTIYTVSGVVGVILAGLSVGYARGGVRADNIPTRLEFFRTIEKGGIALLVLFALMFKAAEALAAALPLSWGPFALALVLFFVPSYYLGMLSPFAIKLGEREHPHAGTGRVSGQVFFWSTCGSLAGTLLTAFVLIPQFGLTAIMCGTTLGVLVLGSGGKICTDTPAKRSRHFGFLVFLVVVLGCVLYASTRTPPGVLFSADGVYQRLVIRDGTYAGRPARFFYQDRSEDDVRFLDGDDLAAAYTKYYALYKILKPDLTHALFIGGGMYSMPAALHRDAPDAHIDIAEIEPSLFSLAQKYFGVPNDPHLANHVVDGRRFLQESSVSYDLIFSDVYYSLYSIPPAYTTKEFFTQARSKLNDGGIFVANFIGNLSPDNPSLILSEIHTLQEVFPQVYVFATVSPDITSNQNIVVVGVTGTSTSAAAFPHVPPTPLPKDLNAHLVPLEQYSLGNYPILTDDYAPVEYMTGKILTDTHTKKVTAAAAPNATSGASVDPSVWSGARAMETIATQLSFGVRALGTPGHQKTINFITSQLASTSAHVLVQNGTYTEAGVPHPLTNIIARFDPSNPRRVVVATHYDSIVRAYADKKSPYAPMPGANNSASGVALLLETARMLDHTKKLSVGIDFVFFDGEEGPQSLGAGDPDWHALGSPFFVQHLSDLYRTAAGHAPEQVAVFDMVCDAHLNVRREPLSLLSAQKQVDAFWKIGQAIAPAAFVTEPSAHISDDQTAFVQAGVPSFLVIDFDYAPWFNTTEDTLDKCSSESLQTIGRTLTQYLYTL